MPVEWHLSERIRIAYLVSRYPATNHTFILREISGLRSMGFDIRVIAIHGSERAAQSMTSEERAEQETTFTVFPIGPRWLGAHAAAILRHPAGYARGLVTALRLSRWNVQKAWFHIFYFLEAVVVGDEMERNRVRHVHVHFSSTVALILARIFPVSFSVTIHGPGEFDDVLGFALSEKVAAATFVVAISRFGCSQIMRSSDPVHWPKIEICRLGVDPDRFAPRSARNHVNRFELLCVGRLAPVKAQQVLLAACARLIRAGWNLRLRIVGDGPDRERLERFAAASDLRSSVVFEGARNQDEVIRMYRETDIFALASFAEGIPVVLMEAMAMEIPCVATWVHGIPELIRDGVEGLLTPPSDEEQFAAAIEYLMKNDDLRRRLGMAARQRIINQYDLRRNIAELAAIFRKRLGNPNRVSAGMS